jgi:hypothetical protein
MTRRQYVDANHIINTVKNALCKKTPITISSTKKQTE